MAKALDLELDMRTAHTRTRPRDNRADVFREALARLDPESFRNWEERLCDAARNGGNRVRVATAPNSNPYGILEIGCCKRS
jgi:hypothetical protein